MPNNLVPQDFDQWMRTMERRINRLESAGQPNTSTPQRIILPGTPEADSTVGNRPPLQIGDGAGQNLRMDQDEVLASNNGSPTTLNLNPGGGNIRVGAESPTSMNMIVGTSAADVQPAYRLTRSRTSGALVETTIYQQANDIPILGFSVYLNSVLETTFSMQGGVTGPGSIRALTGGTTRPITPFSMQAGSVTVTGTGTTTGTQTVSFSSGRFTTNPLVFAISTNINITATVQTVSAAGATIGLHHISDSNWSSNITAYWFAIQMTASDRVG